MNLHLRLSATLVLVCFLQSSLLAQGIGVSVMNNRVQLTGFGEVDLEKTTDAWADSLREEISQKMELQIAQVVDICGLTESETKKVQLAVKGIVSKRIASGSEQVRAFALSSGLVDPNENSEDKEEREYSKQDKLIFYGASHKTGRRCGTGVLFRNSFD